MKPVKFIIPILIAIQIGSCVKDSDYSFPTIVAKELASIQIKLDTTRPADGATKDTIVISILPNDLSDSFNISALNMSISTTGGTFLPGNTMTASLLPTYTLDSITHQRFLAASVVLVSPGMMTTAQVSIKYLQAEIDTTVHFVRAYPTKLLLTASTLFISPDFTSEDTIYAKI